MADTEDDLDAAERALGTLPRDGEGLDEARRRRAWEVRLAPLAELIAPVSPPEGLLGRVMERIGEEEAAGAVRAVRAERRRAGRWRLAAVAAAAAAAVAAIVAFVQPGAPGPGPELVSVAIGEAGEPALLISLDVQRGVATVRPVGLRGPVAGSLELWHIAAGGAPVSLGLVDPQMPGQVPLRAAPGDLAAVSLEPEGGSPTGQPTGPVLYSGPFLMLR